VPRWSQYVEIVLLESVLILRGVWPRSAAATRDDAMTDDNDGRQ
jgi:hypothetical protein